MGVLLNIKSALFDMVVCYMTWVHCSNIPMKYECAIVNPVESWFFL